MFHRRGTPEHPDYDPSWRGPNGRRQCRRCLAEVPKGRRTFCSDACVRDFQLETGSSNWVRLHVRVRDHGVCASCGLDTDRLHRTLTTLSRLIVRSSTDEQVAQMTEHARQRGILCQRWHREAVYHRSQSWTYVGVYRMLLLRFGWSAKQANEGKSLWQADHIVPLIEGGGLLLDNLRTLCVPCHTGETAALAARRKLPRRLGRHRRKSHHTREIDDARPGRPPGRCS